VRRNHLVLRASLGYASIGEGNRGMNEMPTTHLTTAFAKWASPVVASLLLAATAVAQSRPADFISATVGQITPAAVDSFARILFEVTNKSPVTYTGVIFMCSAFDAEKKLMGSSVAAVNNLGPGVTPGRGMINVKPNLGRDVSSASCRVEQVMP
jgi:hypothetical protein